MLFIWTLLLHAPIRFRPITLPLNFLFWSRSCIKRHHLDQLIQASTKLGLELTDTQIDHFKRYGDLIELRSNQFNLTGVKTWERIREELFIRSLRILSPAGGNVPTLEWFAGRKAIDIGTGAGIPGLVLKLAVPELEITLLDSIGKRTTFLNEVVSELDLTGVEVVNGRAEEFGQDELYREQYDLVVARAVASLPELAELTLPFLNVGGVAVLPKSTGIEQELREAEFAAEELGAAPAITLTVDNPGSSPADEIVYWMKISSTPEKFPRRVGVPHQAPLLSN